MVSRVLWAYVDCDDVNARDVADDGGDDKPSVGGGEAGARVVVRADERGLREHALVRQLRERRAAQLLGLTSHDIDVRLDVLLDKPRGDLSGRGRVARLTRDGRHMHKKAKATRRGEGDRLEWR